GAGVDRFLLGLRHRRQPPPVPAEQRPADQRAAQRRDTEHGDGGGEEGNDDPGGEGHGKSPDRIHCVRAASPLRRTTRGRGGFAPRSIAPSSSSSGSGALRPAARNGARRRSSMASLSSPPFSEALSELSAAISFQASVPARV